MAEAKVVGWVRVSFERWAPTMEFWASVVDLRATKEILVMNLVACCCLKNMPVGDCG